MIGSANYEMNKTEDNDKLGLSTSSYCRDYVRGCCTRESCRYIHDKPPKHCLKELFRFCHDFQNKGCFRTNCKFIHSTVGQEERFYSSGRLPEDSRIIAVCQSYIQGTCVSNDCMFVHPPEIVGNEVVPTMQIPPFNKLVPPPQINRNDDLPPEAKFRRYDYPENCIETQVLQPPSICNNCETLDHKVRLLHDNISVLLKKVNDLSEKNSQLTSMNEFLLQQTTSRNDHHQPYVITSRHCTSSPVSLATMSVTPIVSLAGALPTLLPAGAAQNITLAPASSRAQLLPAPQILTVSTTQQLVTSNSGALIVTSAGAQQLMQVSDSGTLMGGGQTVVAVTPAQLTLGPPQQLMSNAGGAVQQLVQQSALQPQLAQQHQASQYAAQQSVQHLAAQQSAQHLAAHQSAQHLAAQQTAQHLAAQQTAQHLAAQQSAPQQLVPSAQQLVHQTSTQQITISSTSQPMAMANSQAQPMTFPIISQSMIPH